ncbi:uncharacterized protein LOC117648177 isoform X2 [Thrips palmi]|uniref:Uncharacterized protein LOC117648177 isoform X2 n=1 Tax=Thrips palmi TaxID=161013 RepID=A0A6P8ZQS8_THRPL|nr:uncharacterized protein LOC117648177 isoform X2 [Thrips palmi]
MGSTKVPYCSSVKKAEAHPPTVAPAKSEMELNCLPDHVLLQVMSHLDEDDLLESRGVCRRWRDLALHPMIWQNKSIYFFASSDYIAIALRLVPRLRCLLMDLTCHGDVWDILLATPTAIADITLLFDRKDAMLVALILARQAALGRLKRVTLRLRRNGTLWRDLLPRRLDRGPRALLLQICQTPGLQSVDLKLYVDDEGVLDVLAGKVPVPASLKRLKCRDLLEPYLGLLLNWHAETLEDVSLSFDGPRTTSLLAAMPRLRKLSCPMLTDMQLLRQCRSLTYLKLNLTVFDDAEAVEAGLPGARLLLRSAAARLEHLKITYAPYSSPDVVDLLLSIGRRSGVTALRSLRFMIMRWGPEIRDSESFDEDESESPPPQLVPLAAILPRLPLLTRLDIDSEASDAFLDALDGQVVPKLERLDIRMPRDCACHHSWLHVEEERMRRVMKRYPRLHVFIQTVDKSTCREGDCGFCKSNSCHADMPDGLPCLLRSHRGTGCDVSHVVDKLFPDLPAFEIYIDTSSE